MGAQGTSLKRVGGLGPSGRGKDFDLDIRNSLAGVLSANNAGRAASRAEFEVDFQRRIRRCWQNLDCGCISCCGASDCDGFRPDPYFVRSIGIRQGRGARVRGGSGGRFALGRDCSACNRTSRGSIRHQPAYAQGIMARNRGRNRRLLYRSLVRREICRSGLGGGGRRRKRRNLWAALGRTVPMDPKHGENNDEHEEDQGETKSF